MRLGLRLCIFATAMFAADRAIDAYLRGGLDRYFGLDRKATVLCVGHSRTVLGIDAERLGKELGAPVAKYAVSGANISDRLAMIRHYLSIHSDSVKVITYDVDAYTFAEKGLSSNSYKEFYPFMDSAVMSEHIRNQGDTWGGLAWKKIVLTLRYDDATLALALRGRAGAFANFKTGNIDLELLRHRLEKGLTRRIGVEEASIQAFDETVRFVRARGVKLVLAYIPTIDVLNMSDERGQQKVLEILRGYARRDPGVVFLDYNEDLQHRHELFADAIHLNRDGQRIVTDRLAVDIRALLNRNSVTVADPHSAEQNDIEYACKIAH